MQRGATVGGPPPLERFDQSHCCILLQDEAAAVALAATTALHKVPAMSINRTVITGSKTSVLEELTTTESVQLQLFNRCSVPLLRPPLLRLQGTTHLIQF